MAIHIDLKLTHPGILSSIIVLHQTSLIVDDSELEVATQAATRWSRIRESGSTPPPPYLATKPPLFTTGTPGNVFSSIDRQINYFAIHGAVNGPGLGGRWMKGPARTAPYTISRDSRAHSTGAPNSAAYN